MGTENEAGSVPALGVSYSIALDASRNVVMQTHLSRDDTAAVIDELLDKLIAAGERQAAALRLKDLRRQKSLQEKQLRRVSEDLVRIDEQSQNAFKTSGKRGDYRRSSNEEAHRGNVLVTQERFKEEITALDHMIADCEAQVGTDSSTNR